MREIFVTVSNIEEIIETINFKKIYSFFKKQQIAIYKDGFLYFTNYKTPFNHSVRDSIKSLKDVAVLNYESLSYDNLINAGLFIKQMVMNMFYQKHDKRIPNDLIALQYPNIYLNYDQQDDLKRRASIKVSEKFYLPPILEENIYPLFL